MYAYLAVWVMALQMAEKGDSFAFSTAPVEQRGARLKKIIRNVVSWRPFHDGWLAPEVKGGDRVWSRRRKYESCAMLQLMRVTNAQEEMWAAPAWEPDDALSASERRLRQKGRTTLIKDGKGAGNRLHGVAKCEDDFIDLTDD